MAAVGTTFTEVKLADCFSCGSDLGPFVSSPDGKRQVLCSTCGARGPYERPDLTAEAAWNILSDKPT
jgi:hypothetical protein